MSKVKFPRILPEPVHETAIKFHDDLVKIYTHIRGGYQAEIDQAFDRISRKIGFVVATALPFTFEVGDGRVMGVVVIDGMQGTIFDQLLTEVLEPLSEDRISDLSDGKYTLYLFWYEALKLRLRTDWMEPAHIARRQIDPGILRRENVVEQAQQAVMWDVREPVHWFDPGIFMAAEETMLISAIDEVYPDLRLADRVSYYRHGLGQTLRRDAYTIQDSNPLPAAPIQQAGRQPTQLLTELADLLRRHGY